MLRLALVVGILAAGMVASLFSRFAALLTYVWFALFRPQEFLWADVGNLRLSLVTGLLLLVPSLLTGVLPTLRHPLSLLTMAFLGTGLIAQFTTPWPVTSWPWVDAFTRQAFVVTLAITILNTRRRVVLFIATIAGSIGFHTAKAGLATFGGNVSFGAGLGGAFADSNGYALAGAMILPLLLCAGQNLDPRKQVERVASWGFLLALPLSIFMVIATMSRAGFLSVATGTLTYIALQRRRVVPLVAVVVIVMAALPFVPLPEGYFDRLNTIRTYEDQNETSALSRLHFWQVAVRMSRTYPLGVGFRNYDIAYDDFDFSLGEFGGGRSVHSSHFQVLSELGYPGAVVWIGLFGCAFAMSFRARSFGATPGLALDEARFFVTTGNALIISMATFLVGGSFIALALNDLTWYVFAAVAATDQLVRARQRELRAAAPAAAMPPAMEINFPRRATA